MNLAGKVAVVTGSAKGLGKAFAASLLRNGAKVCLSDVDSSLGQVTCQELKEKFGDTSVSFTKCDVKNRQEIKDLFDKVHQEHKGLDIMVNNAGIANEAAIEDMIDINLRGVIYGTLFAMDMMRKDRGGNGGLIVNMSSIAGFVRAPFVPGYVATKHGVVSYTQSLALHPLTTANDIRMVCLCPAYTDTDIIKDLDDEVKRANDSEMFQQSLIDAGIMSVETVVEAFQKLLSDQDNHGKSLIVSKYQGMKYK